MALLGAHESVGGGQHLAFARILSVGGESLQIFSRNQRQWAHPPLRDEERELFTEAWRDAGQMFVASHASYLVNLASPQDDVVAKSIANLAAELARCAALGISSVVMHPGAHGGAGVEAGLTRLTAGLDRVFAGSDPAVSILLETTAGQGTGLGGSFEELAAIIARSKYPERFGVCVDTCHIFAAGYELRTVEGYAATMDVLARTVGLERVRLFHLNDSKKGLGSRVDRHEHIGQGEIGLAGFQFLLQDERFSHLPMTLETPKGESLVEDRQNLQVLRSLLRR